MREIDCVGGGEVRIQFARYYTPLYEKSIKKAKIKSMATTSFSNKTGVIFFQILFKATVAIWITNIWKSNFYVLCYSDAQL